MFAFQKFALFHRIEINTISSAGKAKNIIGTFGIDIGGAPTETKATLSWALSITDDEVEDISTVHIALLLAAHVSELIDHFLDNSLGRTHFAVATGRNHNQICTRTVRIQRESALAKLWITLNQNRD